MEISKSEVSTNYRYIPTANYSADFFTPGLSYRLLKHNKSWFNGPQILENSNLWEETSLMCNFQVTVAETKLNSILDFNSFSNFSKLLRITCYFHKFISNCKQLNYNIKSPITYWVRMEQQILYTKEYAFLKSKGKLKLEALLPSSNLFMDKEDIIRCRGRVDKSKFDYASRNPTFA